MSSLHHLTLQSRRMRPAEQILGVAKKSFGARQTCIIVSDNGAIAFENVKSHEIEFSKPGSDGQEVMK